MIKIPGRNGFHVLDHGMVALVESMGSDLSIVRNAPASPFEALQFTFEVKAPIFVLRQWHEDRTWSYNEVSAGYGELPAEYYVPEVGQITTQSTSNKQMRTDILNRDRENIREDIIEACGAASLAYKELLAQGCPWELARVVLPVSTYSHMFATVDLHNLMHFLRLRLHSHAQYEIRVYAGAMLELASAVCPVTMAAFKEGV